MRYLTVLIILAGCASSEVLDPSGLDASATAAIVKPQGCVNANGTACSDAGKSNVRVFERK